MPKIPSSHGPIEIRHDARALASKLFFVTAVLVLGHIGVIVATALGHPTLFGLAEKFNLSLEATIPSFFSACLMLLAAGSALLLGLDEKNSRERRYLPWYVVSGGLLFMAVDEASGLHELLVHPTQTILGGESNLGLLHFAWVVPVGLLLVAVVPCFIPFLRDVDTSLRRRCMVAAALFLFGAFGMELLEGAHVERHGRDVGYLLMVTLEEGAEMCSLILFVRAALRHLEGRGRSTVALKLG